MIAFYGRTLKFVLRFQTVTLLVAVATLLLTVYLYIIIPKGFFPIQDTGVIQGISQAPPAIGSKAMAEKQMELTKAVLADPAVESVSSFIGADGTNTTLNSGRMSINLKPIGQRTISASDLIRRLNSGLTKVQGIELFMEPVQDISVDDRVSRTQYQYTLEDSDANELNDWTNRFLARLKQLPQLSWRTWLPISSREVLPCRWRLTGSRRRDWASHLRPSITPCTTLSANGRSTPCIHR
jgi:multidrug efflux pump